MARTDVLYATRRAVPGLPAADVPDAHQSDIPARPGSGVRCRKRDRIPPAPAAGAAVLLIMLGTLAATTGLGPAGWLAGGGYAAGLGATLTAALRRRGSRSLGPADHVTLARATLTGCVTALVADTIHAPAPIGSWSPSPPLPWSLTPSTAMSPGAPRPSRPWAPGSTWRSTPF